MCKFRCSYKKLTSRPLARHQLVEFKPGMLICLAGKSAVPAACENTHLFALHLALESDPAPVLPVCVQVP